MFLKIGETEIMRMDRKSSIETEPRTLNVHQIQFARDAAKYVVNTSTIEEALRIFTQGLEPVETVAKHNNGNPTMDVGEAFDCSVSEVGIPGPRDIASAPF
ncbi:uncharacterized protein LOC131303868 [Rhododendron vialii]|uniref:uncharacterized protein LOC131303868 n=1 Tax=Rhododendron vialii TaxID=182163 RepID=UPI00265E1D82|nr:uncharacterized protein LOC131303868 [Rhododendron vialii]